MFLSDEVKVNIIELEEQLSEEQQKIYENIVNTTWNLSDYEDDYNKEDLLDSIVDLSSEECDLYWIIFEDYTQYADEALKILSDGDYMIYDNCNNMEDVAYYVCQECYGDMFNDNNILTRYFDYKAFGRDLEIEGYFIDMNGSFLEIIR